MAGPKKPSLFGKIAGGIGRWLTGTPKPPTLATPPLQREEMTVEQIENEREEAEGLGGGHRGTAIGSRQHPDYSKENIAKWRTLEGAEVAGFVYEGEPLFVHSTNVEMVQYFIDRQMMIVKFIGKRNKPGGTYQVYPISPTEAIGFAKAFSKGVWYWDVVRIRGTRHGHKKNVLNVVEIVD